MSATILPINISRLPNINNGIPIEIPKIETVNNASKIVTAVPRVKSVAPIPLPFFERDGLNMVLIILNTNETTAHVILNTNRTGKVTIHQIMLPIRKIPLDVRPLKSSNNNK
ncbi:hypothetical protein ABHN11_12835 [Brevibacillus centrosporus]|uniref:hypothetical protein n=1 Tax=Brevibacillus centrosporus TaxID=54910 RepID=UPI003D25EF80